MRRRPPPTRTAFPYTTLFRSLSQSIVYAHGEPNSLWYLKFVPEKPTPIWPPPEAENCAPERSEEHTSELQSPCSRVCRRLLEQQRSGSYRLPYAPCR